MMRYKTNLPQIEFASHRRWRRWLAGSRTTLLIAAVLIMLCGMALHQWYQLSQARQQAKSHLHLFDHANTAAPALQPDRDEPTAKEIETANHLIAELNIPWASLLNALEHNKPQDIALLSVEPATGKPLLLLQAEAKDALMMLAYVDTLKSNPRFVEAELTKHETNLQNPYKPIRFIVRLAWNPAP